jgi:hypothetical protein
MRETAGDAARTVELRHAFDNHTSQIAYADDRWAALLIATGRWSVTLVVGIRKFYLATDSLWAEYQLQKNFSGQLAGYPLAPHARSTGGAGRQWCKRLKRAERRIIIRATFASISVLRSTTT